jgi:hypothetical protein
MRLGISHSTYNLEDCPFQQAPPTPKRKEKKRKENE